MDYLEDLAQVFAVEVMEVAGDLENGAVRRRFHPRDNSFELSDRMFLSTYRLDKVSVEQLIQTLTPYLGPPSRASALDIATKILTALKFFATGSYQMDVASNINLAVSQSSVSRCIREVVDALNHQDVMNRWIHFTTTVPELEQIRHEFYIRNGFPGIVGLIDCTHVAIVPPAEEEHIYVNRKRYHSLNVQLICDASLRIMNVVARFPGSAHDSYIWNQSNVHVALRTLYQRIGNYFYLLGDSGYPLRPWLLSPLDGDHLPDTPGGRYNASHKSTRCGIERCNGVLKQRFRCLLKDRVLHYKPVAAAKIVHACSVLHNMCIANNVPEPQDDDEVEIDNLGLYANLHYDEPMGRVNPDLAEGRRMRRRLMDTHFRN